MHDLQAADGRLYRHQMQLKHSYCAHHRLWFRTTDAFAEHWGEQHAYPLRYECEKCLAPCTNVITYAQHVATHDTDYDCPECPEYFVDQENFRSIWGCMILRSTGVPTAVRASAPMMTGRSTVPLMMRHRTSASILTASKHFAARRFLQSIMLHTPEHARATTRAAPSSFDRDRSASTI